MMMGGRPVYTVNISSSGGSWKRSVDAPTIPSGIPIQLNLNVLAGVERQSASTSIPAIEINGLAAGSVVNFTNLGYAIGRGGNGGAGASGNGAYTDAANGSSGGDALFANFNGTLNITNGAGRLWGGGGGGGGGGGSLHFDGQFTLTNYYGGGGGGGAGGSSGGAGGTGTVPTSNVSGTAGSAGTSASVGAAGSGGAGASGFAAGGAGGAGGGHGSFGFDGNEGTPPISSMEAGVGGSPGNAVRHLSGTTVITLSGASSPNRKGPVST